MSLALALALLAGPPACERADLLPAAGAPKVDARALLDAACGPECVLECPRNLPDREEPLFQLFAHHEGSFRCPGRLESIVSLFPCGEGAGMHGIAGQLVLMQAARPARGRGARWEQAGSIDGAVLNGDCRVDRIGGRDTLVCVTIWGPLHGVMGESLCALRWSGDFGLQCTPAAEDTCGTGDGNARSASVDSWTVGGAAAADGTVPVRLTIKVSECDGTRARKVEGEALLGAEGIALSPPTAERFRKAGIVSE